MEAARHRFACMSIVCLVAMASMNRLAAANTQGDSGHATATVSAPRTPTFLPCLGSAVCMSHRDCMSRRGVPESTCAYESSSGSCCRVSKPTSQEFLRPGVCMSRAIRQYLKAKREWDERSQRKEIEDRKEVTSESSPPSPPPAASTTETPALSPRPVAATSSQETGCGKNRVNEIPSKGVKLCERTSDTRAAQFGEYPWLISIRAPGPEGPSIHRCAATLINLNWAITAAGCLPTKDEPVSLRSLTLRLGEYNMHETNEYLSHEEIRVAKSFVHPEYNKTTMENDLVLLKFDYAVGSDKHIVPICLETEGNSYVGDKGLVTGWGIENGTEAQTLVQRLAIGMITNSNCRNLLYKIDKKITVKTSQVCVSANKCDDGRHIYQGDWGGPITIVRDETTYLVGIVNYRSQWGDNTCPGLHTAVRPLMPWIMETMSKNA